MKWNTSWSSCTVICSFSMYLYIHNSDPELPNLGPAGQSWPVTDYFWPSALARIFNIFNHYYFPAANGLNISLNIYLCCTSSPDHKLTLCYIGGRVALLSSCHLKSGRNTMTREWEVARLGWSVRGSGTLIRESLKNPGNTNTFFWNWFHSNMFNM